MNLLHRFLGQCVAALSCSLALTVAFAGTPEDFRDAYVRWRGGKAFRELHSRHYRGELQAAKLTGTFEAWEDTNGRLRTDIHAGAIEVSTRVDGASGFSLTPGGQVEALSPQDCERRLLSMLTGYATVLEGARGATLGALPEPRGGAQAENGFRVRFPNGDLCDYFLGPDGDLLRSREVVDGKESITTYGDWRIVDAVRQPFTIDSRTTVDHQRTVLKITTDRANADLAPAIFAKPDVASRVSFGGGAADSGTVRCELFAGNRLFISGRSAASNRS